MITEPTSALKSDEAKTAAWLRFVGAPLVAGQTMLVDAKIGGGGEPRPQHEAWNS